MSVKEACGAMRRRGPRTAAALAALAAAALAAACSDGGTEPLQELSIEEVSPVPFAEGDTVTLRGPGVDRAEIALDGRLVDVLDREGGVVRFVAAGLPVCGEPLPRVRILAAAEGLEEAREVEVTGRPVAVDLDAGEHALVPAVGAGCDLAFAAEGTYGVAAYRTALKGVSWKDREDRAYVVARLRGGASVPAALRAPAPGAPEPVAPSAGRVSDVLVPAAAPARVESCRKEPVPVGHRIPLREPWKDGDVGPYEVVSVSPSFAVLVDVDHLGGYTAERRAAANAFAAELEARARPFLDRVFQSWPDSDGDGRLNVVVADGLGSGAYYGGLGIHADDCIGDFVRMDHDVLDRPLDDPVNPPVGLVVHEAMHWYDLGPDPTRKSFVQDWSIEAVAELTQKLWIWERDGADVWGNRGSTCPDDWPNSVPCGTTFLRESRFGWPGLSRGGGYTHGMYLTLWLVQQALEAGDPPAATLGLLRRRNVPAPYEEDALRRTTVAIAPLFEAAGGSGRTEAELQGEYLLSFYADDFVEGISPRLTNRAWDLARSGPLYPLRRFVMGREHAMEIFGLAKPDGIVFEVTALPGSVLTLTPSTDDLHLAVVRAR